jgi:hypothetical protein
MFAGEMKKLNKTLISFICFWILLVLAQPTSWASSSDDKGLGAKAEPPNIEKKWGIRPLSIRLSAAGSLLDYRFMVIDPDKAVALMKRGDKAFLIDQASGVKLPVPRTKVGPLRQTGTKPKAGKVYPILFSNTGKVIRSGSKVTLVIGNFRMENIVIGAPIPHQANLPKAKQAKWEAVHKTLRYELGSCIKDCGQDRPCLDRCDKAYKSRLNKEYQKLTNEK